MERVLHLWRKPELFHEFEAEQLLRPANTARATLTTLRDFITFHAHQYGTPEAARFLLHCTADDVTLYFNSLKERTAPAGGALTDGTIRTRYWLLRACFRWLQGRGYRADNPAAQLHIKATRTLSRQSALIPYARVTAEIRRALLENSVEGLERAALFSVLFYGALRRSEAVALTMADVVEADGTLTLFLKNTKAQESATVALSEQGAWVVRLWVRSLNLANPCPPNERSNQKLFPDYCICKLYRTFKQCFGVPPHAARATAITRLLELGHDPAEVQLFARLHAAGMVNVYDRRLHEASKSAGAALTF
jgi:integrase